MLLSFNNSLFQQNNPNSALMTQMVANISSRIGILTSVMEVFDFGFDWSWEANFALRFCSSKLNSDWLLRCSDNSHSTPFLVYLINYAIEIKADLTDLLLTVKIKQNIVIWWLFDIQGIYGCFGFFSANLKTWAIK